MSTQDNRQYLEIEERKVRDQYKSADGDGQDNKNKIFYHTHNMQQNLLNASASKDAGMKRDILLSEISKLVINYPSEVQAALHNVFPGVNAFYPERQLGTKALGDYVADGLHRSRIFAEKIATMIVSGGKAPADGYAADQQPGTFENILKGVSDVTSGIGSIFAGKKKAKAASAAQASQAAAEAEKAKAALQAQIAAMNKAKGAGSNIMWWVLGGLGVAGLLGGIYWYQNR